MRIIRKLIEAKKPKDKKFTLLQARMETELHSRMKQWCEENHVTIQEFVNASVMDTLEMLKNEREL